MAGRLAVLILVAMWLTTTTTHAQKMVLPDEFTVADVARYDSLPMRYFLRDEFRSFKAKWFFDERYKDTFVRILQEDHTDELYIKAARSLERIANEELSDPAGFVTALRERLQATTSLNVKRACATALVAADSKEDAALLSTLCIPSNETLCLRIEPWLAAIQSDVLQSTWSERVRSPDKVSRTLLVLACNGLGALNSTSELSPLTDIVANGVGGFGVQRAAAGAIAQLSAEDAIKLAEPLLGGIVTDRLLAVRLLSASKDDEALKTLETLCEDKENSVASRAWNVLLKLDGKRLLPRLEKFHVYRDPNVRSVVTEAARQFPSQERCELLNRILGDAHIGVRNEARRALQFLAETEPELNKLIKTNAGAVLTDSSANWQQLEQALVLLGSLRHYEYQNDCIPLLKHDRAEVLVSASWLLHLHPDSIPAADTVEEANRKWSEVKAGGMNWERVHAYSLQIAYLCQIAAETDSRNVIQLCKDMFSKDVDLSHETRSVALWTLGTLMIDTKDEDLQKKFTERIFDDSPLMPEEMVVRAGAAFSLGLLGNPTAVADLKKARQSYGSEGEVGFSAATALERFGVEVPPPSPQLEVSISDWPIGFVE